MDYFERLLANLRSDASYDNVLRHMINVFSPYYLCNHFVGNEAWRWLGLHRIPGKTDLMSTGDLTVIKDYDIIVCQVNFLEHFVNIMLPNIDKKIVLITSQFEFPQLYKTDLTDRVLKESKIVLWFSTNPIYEPSEKYVPFPCGMALWQENLKEYARILLLEECEKTAEIAHMHLSQTNPCRELIPKADKCEITEYYENIRRARFVISPIGDRDDCYRHYEAIGLGAIPLSNIGEYYRPIFQNNMYYCPIEEIVEAVMNQKVGVEYIPPNRDLICFEYYKDYVRSRIEQIREDSF